ncbi:MAG: transposase [Alphaproteobacteria bacterium]|nr:transposase [Alphaproteobacteria bacterium]
MKEYTIELKSEVLKQIKENGVSRKEISLKYEIPIKTLEKWITQYNKDHNVFNKETKSQEEEIKRLKRELKRSQTDLEILKKTLILLSKAN